MKRLHNLLSYLLAKFSLIIRVMLTLRIGNARDKESKPSTRKGRNINEES